MTEKEIESLAYDMMADFRKSVQNEHLHSWVAYHEGVKAGYQAAMKENEKLKRERDAYKKVAEEWMNDYDELKSKYEPMVAVTSEGETK